MTNEKKRHRKIMICLLSKIALILGVPLCSGQTGQTAGDKSAQTPARMTFDIASVRENKNIDVNAGFMVSGGFESKTTTFRAVNWSIEDLIGNAYGVHRSQIVGGPKWPWPTLFHC